MVGTGERRYSTDDGPALQRPLAGGGDLAVDARGNLYYADIYRVRRVSPDGYVTTVAGTGVRGFSGDGGPATRAQLTGPSQITVDDAGSLYLAGGLRIRKVDPDGIIRTIAGTGEQGYSGDGGPAAQAMHWDPSGNVIDGQGAIIFGDGYHVRKILRDGTIRAIAGGGLRIGDGGPAVGAALDPVDVAVDRSGDLFIADTLNCRIRKVATDGTISTVAGIGPAGYDAYERPIGASSGDGGPAGRAMLSLPRSIAVDAAGELFIAEGARVRKISPDGTITTAAGTGTAGYDGDGGPAVEAALNLPSGLAIDAAGSVFIADTGNALVRKVSPDGQITTVAGSAPPITPGDVNRDRRIDLRDGTLALKAAIGQIALSPTWKTAADMDGDGRVDGCVPHPPRCHQRRRPPGAIALASPR